MAAAVQPPQQRVVSAAHCSQASGLLMSNTPFAQQQRYVPQPQAAVAAAAGSGPGRPASAPAGPQSSQQHHLRPYEQRTLELNPELAGIEQHMRQQLHARAAVHMPEKIVLLQAFAKVWY